MSTTNAIDLRKYQRLTVECRVDFRQCAVQSELLDTQWYRASTKNVSKTGICIDAQALNPQVINFIESQQIYLELLVYLPMAMNPIRLVSEIVWSQSLSEYPAQVYRIGLKFRSASEDDIQQLLSFAEKPYRRFYPFIGLAAVGLTLLLFFLL